MSLPHILTDRILQAWEIKKVSPKLGSVDRLFSFISAISVQIIDLYLFTGHKAT